MVCVLCVWYIYDVFVHCVCHDFVVCCVFMCVFVCVEVLFSLHESQIPLSPSVSTLIMLHWLSIPSRIAYKIDSLCHTALTSAYPKYLSELLNVYTPA